MSKVIEGFKSLFEYPQEYSFLPRESATLRLPKNFFPPHLVDRAGDISHGIMYHRDRDEPIPLHIHDLNEEPNLEFAAKYGRKDPFCFFNPNDRAVSTKLITMFMESRNEPEFLALATYIRDRINPFLFQYAYSVAVQHIPGLRGLKPPLVVTQFPSNFIDPSTLQQAKEDAKIIHSTSMDRGRHSSKFKPSADDPSKLTYEVPLNYTASGREEEQRMAYFREDIGINMHHWHWHLVFPNNGPIEIVRKDRRGELFMYMHNQIIARYNLERFCNDLGKTLALGNLRDPIPEGYYPKLLESVSNRTYPARMPGQKLHDMNRPDLLVAIGDLERWTDRISSSIDRGYVFKPEGERIPLDEKHGIDLLGNLIESSSLSINPQFYGDLHNLGHLIISYIHDPDLKYLELNGVMGDITTAMRDPIFYRWHTFIDNLGRMHKALLPPYGPEQLRYKDIIVEEITAVSKAHDSQANVMQTFWQKSDVEIGVDLSFRGKPEDGNANFRFTHLQHVPFEYNISVYNKRPHGVQATCRIFLLPKDDERMVGLTLEEQRLLAVELDRFHVDLSPGPNRIVRLSEESSVTIPFTSVFKPRPDKLGDPMEKCLRDFCSCGWPNHMLLPKGTSGGKVFKLFVMISDDIIQSVPEDDDIEKLPPWLIMRPREIIGKAYSFCGLKNAKYPDVRSMGFPFDRKLPAVKLDGLLQEYANMKSCDLSIVFQGMDKNPLFKDQV